MSSLLKSIDLAGLVNANSITDFRVSDQSVLFPPKFLKYFKTTPTSQKVEYLANGGLSLYTLKHPCN